MGRKASNKKIDKEVEVEKPSWLSTLHADTRDTILAIVLIVLALLLLFAALDKAGVVGDKVFHFLSLLFGLGYYLLLVALVLLSVSFFMSYKHAVAWPKLVGTAVFFASGLGLIELIQKDKGGIVGELIASPLVKLFDIWVSYIILIALVILSFVITFNTPLRFSFLTRDIFNWNKREGDEDLVDFEDTETTDPAEDLGETEDQGVSVARGAPIPDPSVSEVKKKNAGGLIFFSRKGKNMGAFTPPPLSLLNRDSGKPGVGDIKANANIIKRTLKNFGIDVEMDEISVGPSITRYALKPAEGVKLARIVALQNDLALALAAHPLRIEAPIPGKSLVGIEIPNTTKTTVGLGSLLADPGFNESDKALTVCLGKGITGLSHFANLAKLPHVLIAGTTGSGKSVTIHALITSLLYRNAPDQLKFIMIDPKRVELTQYNNIPHLLTPVITDAKKVILALKWAAKEMDRRYDILEAKKVRDIASYHKNILYPAMEKGADEMPDQMPYIVIIMDELADLMQAYPRELESGIVRLAQMSRAVGIHLMLSTQRPSVNVITGLIKANIPARVALQVSSQIDSRTILDMPGAEKLLGAGDMLYLSGEMSQPSRLQSAYITEEEVKKVVEWLINHYGDETADAELDLEGKNEPNPIFEAFDTGAMDDGEEDPLYGEALKIVKEAGKGSTSYIQRKLRVGYSRAARLMDMLEERGVIGPQDGSRPREIVGGGESNNNSIKEAPDDEEIIDEDAEENPENKF